jgi:hypothetical protein
LGEGVAIRNWPALLRTMLQHVTPVQSIPLSQYLCSKCGSILCETATDIEISSVKEECPTCGTMLAQSLTKRSNEQKVLQRPKLQTAYDLLRFSFDIEKLDSVMRLGSAGSLCIVGHNANLILSRLCVRALMPTRFGGLDSPHVMIVDAGNKSDLYQTVSFIRQYHMNVDNTLDRIIVNRPFTIHQLKRLITTQISKDVQQYQLKVIIIPGLLDLFADPNIKKKEAKRVIERIMKTIQSLSEGVLVVASIQDGKYSSLVLPGFDKRLVILKAENNRLSIALNKKSSITLTERELKIVNRK